MDHGIADLNFRPRAPYFSEHAWRSDPLAVLWLGFLGQVAMRPKFMIPLALAFCFAIPARGEAPPHLLSQDESRAWISAVSSHRTDDGATVQQVLDYTQKLRPSEFKFGKYEIIYDQVTGNPQYVAVEWWIGLMRLPDDLAVNAFYRVKKVSGHLKAFPAGNMGDIALERGRYQFLGWIDDIYDAICVRYTVRKSC